MSAPATQRLLWRQVLARTSSSVSAKQQQHIFAGRARTPITATASFRTSAASSPVLRSARNTRRAYSTEPPRNTNNVKFWPFLVIIAAGSGGYVLLANQRKDMSTTTDAPHQLGAPAKPTPAFSPDDVTVVFVLGGPGAGKGTQCARLVRDYGFTHLSAGDLLRAEQQRPGSQFGDLIRDYIKNGQIVPMEVTVQLLENAMAAAIDPSGAGDVRGKKGRFLIDGFPRKFDQAVKFEEAVCPARLVLFFDCPEAEMERRLLERGKTSGRADDNADSIRKRFRTFVETSMPVVDYYAGQGKVLKIDARPDPDDVYRKTQRELEARLSKELQKA
ncbi:bifunctional uridylate/adenylate kinase [Diatrype stigma]|uniref:Uridylate kinase n=1 Tax=Diatrype stigma TaxID=117547 RepID=A0AAN9V0Z1_9PEZI